MHEFYANLSIYRFGNYSSFVRDKNIMFNVLVLNSIIRVENPSIVPIFTKKCHANLDGFLALEQLKVIHNLFGLLEYVNPTTSMITIMANFLFKICIANICPR